jgi:hypothetical protein
VAYPSYVSFVEDVVLPRRASNPHHKRLDGAVAGGNWAVAGVFRGGGGEWKVHEDSHYGPLLAAYEAARAGDPWPFVEEATKTGTALDLKPELRERMTDNRHKYIYIYSV